MVGFYSEILLIGSQESKLGVKMDYFNIGNNLYLLTIIIRMFIGIILISKFLKIRHKQTIFSNTMHPLDKPDAYFDFWLPLLNVNYSPYCYIIPEIFLIIVLAWILKKIYLEDNVK